MRYLFFSAEAESPAGYYLMNMWHPVEMAFNAIHVASEYGDHLDSICIVFVCTSEQLLSNGFYPERKYISHKKRFADYRVHVPYLEFDLKFLEKKNFFNYILTQILFGYIKLKQLVDTNLKST